MNRISVICILILLFITLFANNVKVISAETMPKTEFSITPESYSGGTTVVEGITYLELPSDSSPMGIVYDNLTKVVWVALNGKYWVYNGSIAKIDVASKNCIIYTLPWDVGQGYRYPKPWTIAIDGDGNLWITIRNYLNTPDHPPSTVPYLAKFNTTSKDFTMIWIPTELAGGSDITYYQNYIWYMSPNALAKINYTTNTVVESHIKNFYGEGYLKADKGCIWMTSVMGNFTTRFNMTSKNFDVNLTGFDRPLGIEVDSDFVYVAENSGTTGKMGTIAKINKADFTVSRINTTLITREGPYHVHKDSDGNLWWTDNSGHVGYFETTGILTTKNAIGPCCYFMTDVLNSSVWFSCVGSAHIGIPKRVVEHDIDRDGDIDQFDYWAFCGAFIDYYEIHVLDERCDFDVDLDIDAHDFWSVCGAFIDYWKIH